MQQVANALGIDITTFSRQIKTMAEKGLIEKRSDKGDKRVSVLSLTPEGKSTKNRIDREMNQYVEKILVHMSPFEQEMVVHAMKLMNQSLLKTGSSCTGGKTCKEQLTK